MTDRKMHSHKILLHAVRAMFIENGHDVRDAKRSDLASFFVAPDSSFPNGLDVIVRTQNVSGSTDAKAKELRDQAITQYSSNRPVLFVVDGHKSDKWREILNQVTPSATMGVFTIRDLLLWMLKEEHAKPRQAVMF
jgi:hypothetical protein